MRRLQVYIGRAQVTTFSLIADMNYVGDNAPRLARALFEIALRNQWTLVVERMLTVCPAAIKTVSRVPHSEVVWTYTALSQPAMSALLLEDNCRMCIHYMSPATPLWWIHMQLSVARSLSRWLNVAIATLNISSRQAGLGCRFARCWRSACG